MGILNSKRKEYQKISAEYEKKSMVDNNYYLLSSNYFKNILNNKDLDDKNLEFFYDLCKEWDDYGSIPLELGNSIEKVLNDERLYLGIHRTDSDAKIDKDSYLESELVDNIVKNGLKNNGDLSSGVVSVEAPDPNKTISPINNILDAVIYLKSQYKHSNIGVLLTLPKKFVNDELDIINNNESNIYNHTKDGFYIKPKFITGVIYQKDGNCAYFPKEYIKSKTSEKKVEVI